MSRGFFGWHRTILFSRHYYLMRNIQIQGEKHACGIDKRMATTPASFREGMGIFFCHQYRSVSKRVLLFFYVIFISDSLSLRASFFLWRMTTSGFMWEKKKASFSSVYVSLVYPRFSFLFISKLSRSFLLIETSVKPKLSTMKSTNSSSDLLQSRQVSPIGSNPKSMRRASLNITSQRQNTHFVNPRRPNLSAVRNDFLSQNTSSTFSIPILVDVMNKFFQATQTMEEEIMLPSRLKDMPIEGRPSWPTSFCSIFTLLLFIRSHTGQFGATRELARTLLIRSRHAQSTEMHSSVCRRWRTHDVEKVWRNNNKVFQWRRRCGSVQSRSSARFFSFVHRFIEWIGPEHRVSLVRDDQRRTETTLLRSARLFG